MFTSPDEFHFLSIDHIKFSAENVYESPFCVFIEIIPLRLWMCFVSAQFNHRKFGFYVSLSTRASRVNGRASESVMRENVVYAFAIYCFGHRVSNTSICCFVNAEIDEQHYYQQNQQQQHQECVIVYINVINTIEKCCFCTEKPHTCNKHTYGSDSEVHFLFQ